MVIVRVYWRINLVIGKVKNIVNISDFLEYFWVNAEKLLLMVERSHIQATFTRDASKATELTKAFFNSFAKHRLPSVISNAHLTRR